MILSFCISISVVLGFLVGPMRVGRGGVECFLVWVVFVVVFCQFDVGIEEWVGVGFCCLRLDVASAFELFL